MQRTKGLTVLLCSDVRRFLQHVQAFARPLAVDRQPVMRLMPESENSMSYRSPPVLLATVLLILAGCDAVQEASDIEGVWYASAEFHERYLVITDERFAWYVKQSASPCYLEAAQEIDRVEGDVYTLVVFRIRQPGQEVPYEELPKAEAEVPG